MTPKESNKENSSAHFSSQSIQDCISLLQSLVNHPEGFVQLSEAQKVAILTASGQLSRPSREEYRKRRKAVEQEKHLIIVKEDRKARATTGIRDARTAAVFSAPLLLAAPNPIEHELHSARNCYVCKKEYTKLHFFYDAMCSECGDFNYQKRFQSVSLKGQVALITGARLKIGYHAALMMLKAGATVIATTRFPVDAALRFSAEPDYPLWKDRLQIHGLDLRHTPSVELFATYIEQHYDRLDILINNAAQTVRRPSGFYTHLMPNENLAFSEIEPRAQVLLTHHESCKNQLMSFGTQETHANPAAAVAWHGQGPGVGLRASAQLSQIPYNFDNSLDAAEVFPEGKLDADLQQVDLRTTNSWRLRLGEIQTLEMLEVQLVNAVAPFVLCNRLVTMMRRDNTGQKHIVNVTAMEGKFHRFKKEDRHPHTNMAKAALNMLTHTSASDFAKDGIFMNAVDTGWVTDEDPAHISSQKQKVHDFQPPLDIVDGAARLCDPFIDGIITGTHWCGKFLKDYRPIDW